MLPSLVKLSEDKLETTPSPLMESTAQSNPLLVLLSLAKLERDQACQPQLSLSISRVEGMLLSTERSSHTLTTGLTTKLGVASTLQLKESLSTSQLDLTCLSMLRTPQDSMPSLLRVNSSLPQILIQTITEPSIATTSSSTRVRWKLVPKNSPTLPKSPSPCTVTLRVHTFQSTVTRLSV